MVSRSLLRSLGTVWLIVGLAACDDGPDSVLDPATDAAATDAAATDAAADAARDSRVDPRLDMALLDGALLDGALLDGALLDGAPSDALPPDALPPDALPPDALPPDAAPDAGACIFVPPEPDCSPAGRGHPDGVPVPYEVVSTGFDDGFDRARVHIADRCQLPIEDLGPVVITDDPSFFALQRCFGDAMPEPSGVDWAAWRLALYPTRESPETHVRWVVDDGGTLFVGAELPAYCGGPAPGTGLVAVLLPADGTAVAERLAGCVTGDGLDCCACEVVCDPEPRRLDCECPP